MENGNGTCLFREVYLLSSDFQRENVVPAPLQLSDKEFHLIMKPEAR